ncbi:MAG TPA: LCP family protein [Candidatus Dormibacteraeota bacterium]
MVLGVVLAAAAGYVVLVAARVGRITHQSPLSVIHDIIRGGAGSSIDDRVSAGKPVTLALYGYGGAGHDGAYLTDSILLVMIHPRVNDAPLVTEVSVPRDWYVPIDLGNGTVVHDRINTAYADAAEEVYPNRGAQYKGEFGPAHLAGDTLDRLLGIHIDHFVAMDFHAFQYAVDAVGGVDITVARSFTDSHYPRGECNGGSGDCAVETVHFTAGPQHMSGARALIFSRSREGDNGEGTDFARSRRQQLVLNAVKLKVVSVGGIAALPAVLDALGGHVVTDLTLGDAESLYGLIKDVPTSAVTHVSIDDQNFLYACGYPVNCSAYWLYTRDPSYLSIQHFMSKLPIDPALLAERQTITVVDASGAGGGASARWAGLLSQLGFSVRDAGAAPNVAATEVLRTAASGSGAATADWLSGYFGARLVTPPATATAGPAPAGITLMLGADEEHAFTTSVVAGASP